MINLFSNQIIFQNNYSTATDAALLTEFIHTKYNNQRSLNTQNPAVHGLLADSIE